MNKLMLTWPDDMMLTQKAQHSCFFKFLLFFAYFGDVLWRLSHGFKYIYRRWQINIFKISNGVGISPWVLHLGHILHHFGLKLSVYGPRLNHGQPVGGSTWRGLESEQSCFRRTKESRQSTGRWTSSAAQPCSHRSPPWQTLRQCKRHWRPPLNQ